MCWLGVQVAFSLSFEGKYHLGGLGVFSVLQRWSFDGPEVIQQRGYVLAVSAGSLFASQGNIILRVQWFLFSLFFLCLFLKTFFILLSCSCSLSDRISVFYQKKKKEKRSHQGVGGESGGGVGGGTSERVVGFVVVVVVLGQ